MDGAAVVGSKDFYTILLQGQGYEGSSLRIMVVNKVKYVSGIDLVSVVTEKNNNAAGEFIRDILVKHPDVQGHILKRKFRGKCMKNTPSFNARGCVMLMNLLPSPKAALWRCKCADALVRYLGGDQSLIDEIEKNNGAQNLLHTPHPTHQTARLFGAAVETVGKRKLDDELELKERTLALALEERKFALEERTFALKQRRFELFFQNSELDHRELTIRDGIAKCSF